MLASLGIIEVRSWSAAMAVLDAAEKAAPVRLLQAELNDLPGVCIKLAGDTSDTEAAVAAARAMAERLQVTCVAEVINAPDPGSGPAYQSAPEFSPLIEQDVVFFPQPSQERTPMDPAAQAIGMIETQGLTAVIEAIDTACKAAAVEVIGREKLGGGYITVLIRGEVGAVQTAIDAGRARIEQLALGKLIAAHVIARPSAAVLSLLPKG